MKYYGELYYMMHTELPFVSRVGMYLTGFSQKNQYLWNASCPVCGDMSKGKQKKRFYIYRPGNANHLNVKCHHCGLSTSFGGFLKTQFPEMFREFVFDNYASTNKKHVPHKNIEEVYKPKKIPIQEELRDSNLDNLHPCKTLDDNHFVAEFLNKRKINRDKWHLLYYTEEFKKYTNSLIPGKLTSGEEHPRLIVPYFNNHGKMFAYVGRAFDNREPRYFTIKLDDSERVYGLDRIDTKFKKVYAVEGALDSLFIPNCIAVSGSNFDCETIRAIKSVITLVPDNEPRSREICKLIKKHIDLGYKVCMLPHTVKTKDINEHILSGFTPEEVVALIDAHTYQGAEALLRFTHWKQV